jgi:hypothetical protein
MQYDSSDDEKGSLPCHEKLAFATREQAEAVAAVNAYRYGGKLHAYKCRHCGLWHLSSQPRDS